MILDQPTAALDARSEFDVFQRFKDLSAGKTAVLISHRFCSVRMADRILVLADGRLEAMGTHEELLAQRGRYAKLFSSFKRKKESPIHEERIACRSCEHANCQILFRHIYRPGICARRRAAPR